MSACKVRVVVFGDNTRQALVIKTNFSQAFCTIRCTYLPFYLSNLKKYLKIYDNKKICEEYIYTGSWPETPFDDEEIKGLMGEQYENYFDKES